ncbi:HNH endonuclease signature motif containing protein [Tuberibacillus sp. Marseille-P3662]|uniref:HNH endonuclease signature motif containing protein n=1 Tax=Tuberibacillus sp. Marseille-P3662 TaxID=1965358 RepID=UPI000A1C8CAA|nr:HNH endonuclease signature motif containing protein [Tuberibacillus sp. Marseille-P3662]
MPNKSFYKSKAWAKCRTYVLTRDHYLCQVCIKDGKLTPANTVHHIESLEDRPDLALDYHNLESICPTCHNKEHPEKGRRQGDKGKPKRNKLKVVRSCANREMT